MGEPHNDAELEEKLKFTNCELARIHDLLEQFADILGDMIPYMMNTAEQARFANEKIKIARELASKAESMVDEEEL